VLQIIDSLNVGGAEVIAVDIANNLFEQNIDSHLCVSRKEGDLYKNINKGIGYIFIGRKKKVDVLAIIRLGKYIKVNRINVIHAHSSSYFIAVCVKIICPKVKIIWHDHFGNSEFLEKREKGVLGLASNYFSAIISVNTKLKIWAQNELKAKNVYFIHNFPQFKNKEKVTFLKGVNSKRIVHLAGFREQKDHPNLLKSFALVLKESPGWTLHLIGKVYEDTYSKEIKNFISANKLSKSVYLYDVCSDIEHILSQAEIGVLSSKSEGLPISLLEYGLAKLSVLVTNVGECRSVVKHERAIVEPNNPEKFSKALLLLVNSKTLRDEISLNLNHKVELEYSKKSIINELIQIYKSVW